MRTAVSIWDSKFIFRLQSKTYDTYPNRVRHLSFELVNGKKF
jgi:hypothetical protein